MADITRVVQ